MLSKTRPQGSLAKVCEGMRILIAEDQDMARLILATHLRKWGHEVLEARDGREALDHIVREPESFDMLITDWSMPRMDGVELASRVRELSNASQYIYIILLTGRGEGNDIVEGFSLGGVDDYVVKPFAAAELQMRIQVGNRVIRAERSQRLLNSDLQGIVRQQTTIIRETQDEIISRLFSALEFRDEETGCHVQRIGCMSAFLGELLGWEASVIDLITGAAPLHDIGKIGVPDTVLRKPDRLTSDEFRVIARHSEIGAHILSNSHNPTIQMAERIARSHHENWDGSGYPHGQQGEDIPLVARVVSIVDVYDALLSDRVYRPGLPLDEVLRIMHLGSGSKFDPVLLQLFFDNLSAIRAACETH